MKYFLELLNKLYYSSNTERKSIIMMLIQVATVKNHPNREYGLPSFQDFREYFSNSF